MAQTRSETLEPLAIIGFSFKFPSGIESSESFWNMMMQGDTGLSEIPEDRLNLQAFLDISGNRSETGQGQKPKGYFMHSRIDEFDAPFFSITAEEAMAMDPQQRLLLETTYHALENAGVPLSKVHGSKTSVHVGCLSYDYRLAISRDAEAATKYSVTGTEAVVAGTSLTLMPDLFLYLDNMGFLSPNSRCHSFDSRANGYARSEGLGVILIKRLDDAIRDKDIIRAVIRSTGSNSDGYTPGITQPSETSQLALIRDTYAKAGLSMEPTRFCEAHGTGTLLGDPIESNAIGTAFRPSRSTDDPLYIGASKANIGHLGAASGIAGIIKSILILERGVIPPIADLVELNPNIDDVHYKLKFPKKAVEWPGNSVRRASVNSFGFGGTNAHVVLDDAHGYLAERGLTAEANYLYTDETLDARPHMDRGSGNRPYLLILSAADRNGIQRLGNAYASYFSNQDIAKDSDVCRRLAFTLNNRRTSLSWRSYAVANSSQSLVSTLNELSTPKRPSDNKTPKIAFVFTGQGAQWPRMGVELMQYSAFAESIRQSSRYIEALGCSWNLIEEMHKDNSVSRMNEPEISQPVSCALQIALVDLLGRANIEPSVVLGHSSGEVAAAYCKGALSHHSAIKIAYYRGMGGAVASRDEKKRTMMSVGLSEDEAIAILKDISGNYNDIHIACINSPSNVTLAGDEIHLNALKAILDGKGTFARKLKVSCAYHSPHMIPIAKEYFSRAGRLEARFKADALATKHIPMISYLDGKEVSNERLLNLEYWITNMCSAVRFPDNVSAIDRLASLANGRKRLDLSHHKGIQITNILEVGPHSALKGPIREIMKGFNFARDIDYESVLLRGSSGIESLLRAAGGLYCSGLKPDIAYLNSNEEKFAQKVTPLADLPPYPFAHTRTYWNESRRSKAERLRPCRPNELLGNPSPDWHPFSATWRNFLNRSKSEWLEDHTINDAVLFPGAGMLTMAIEAMNQYARETLDITPTAFSLKQIEFMSAIQIPDASVDLEVQILLRPIEEGNIKLGWFEFEVFSSDNEQWKKSCKGLIQAENNDSVDTMTLSPNLGNAHVRNTNTVLDDSGVPSRSPSVPGSPNVFSDQESIGTAPSSPTTPTHDTKSDKDNTRSDSRRLFSATTSVEVLPTQRFFDKIREAGYQYGPSFQRIDQIQYRAPGEVWATINAYEQPSSNSHRGHGTRMIETANIIHPATLDAFFQLPLANILRDQPKMSTMIPSRIKTLWISGIGLRSGSKPLRTTAWHNFSGYRGSEHTVSAVDSNNIIKIEVTGYEMTRVSGGEGELEEISPYDLHHCWKFKWEPTAIPQNHPSNFHSNLIEVHVHNPDPSTMDLANILKSRVEVDATTICKIIFSARDLDDSANIRIVLWDVDKESILSNMDGAGLQMVQRALNTSNNVLWIQTSDYKSVEFASQHLVDGLSRVVRQEHSMASFATLSLSTSGSTTQSRVKAISQVCQILLSGTDSLNLPQTFRETSTGEIEFYRLIEATELTKKVQSARLAPVPTKAAWGECKPLKIAVASPGVLDTIHFVGDLDNDGEQSLGDNEVEVAVKAAGVNFKDCLIALGALNESKIGSEISGVVRRIGRDTEGHNLLPGDRVCGFAADGYRTFYRTQGSSLSRVPRSALLSDVDAASIPVNFATAWHALKHVARLEAGESILIHSAAGGTGQAAIQIALYLGATVFATVSTQEKRDLLTTKYNIPPDHIFNSRDTKFAAEIKRMAHGVDVVLNSLSGDVLFSSWECMAPFGRFVEIGKKDIQSQGRLPMAQFEKNISFSAVDLGHMAIVRPKYVAQLVNEVLAIFNRPGGLQTVYDVQKFDISEIVEAFRLIGSGKSTGKIVIEMKPQSQVPVLLPPKQNSHFSPNGSYIIAGGLGGLGRVAARWMAIRGVKHLILLSRSGPRTENAKKFIEELEGMGVKCIAPACDISNRSLLQKTLGSLDIPPIKGCIQSSMVLRSALFADMKHSEWAEATEAKVAGSWNLHELLPKDLDFFILLSSVQAVFGARTQSNYNAANTYMDGLALHRVSRGLKAVSVMLGVVTTDGYLAEAEHQDERNLLLAQNTYHGVETPDFHAMLDYYCDSSMPMLPVEEAQVTFGMKLLYEDPDLDPLGTIWGRNPMFQALRRLTEAESPKGSKDSGKKDLASLMVAANTAEDAAQVVMSALTTRLSSTIAGMDPEEMDRSKPIQAYGVDSLQTMELRSWFLRYFKADLPTFSILGAPSLTALANSIVEKSALRAKV
ncbi:hypothetical protein TWF694_010628 [Orbilia ellipsospora]|uniref:Polyketide synthase n=1 Tax=Orbilia ellipsospora TaxID=2528407 RepID=A0AAV9XGR6_9PEZI